MYFYHFVSPFQSFQVNLLLFSPLLSSLFLYFSLSLSLSFSLAAFASHTRKWSASFGFNHREALPGHPVHPSPVLRFPRCMAGGEIASTKPQEPAVMCKSTTTTTTTTTRRRRRRAERAHTSSPRRHGVYTHARFKSRPNATKSISEALLIVLL